MALTSESVISFSSLLPLLLFHKFEDESSVHVYIFILTLIQNLRVSLSTAMKHIKGRK